MLRREFVIGSVGSLVGVLLLGGSSRAQNAAALDQLIAAAKKEGRITFYNGQTAVPEPEAVAAAFEAKYGIKVDLLEARGAELMERIRVEGTNNKVGGDLVMMGSTGVVPMARSGLLALPGSVPNLERLALKPWAGEEAPVYVIDYGICINTNLVPPADEPKSWRDLLNPKWKGKILSDEMTVPSQGQTWFAVMLDTFGPEFHEQLAKQDLQYSRITTEKAKRVARGEFAMSIPFTLQEMVGLEGLPVKGIVPQEGSPYTPVSVAVIKGAAHPNAAKLLMNFFLEPEAQIIFARSGYPVAIGGLADKIPEKWRFSVNAKLLGHADIDKQDERLSLAGKIYNRK